MLEKLTHEMFEPLIGQKFQVTAPDHESLEFELVDVEPLPTPRRRSRRAETPKRAPFSLFFVGPVLLPQAMYSFQHETFGPEPMSIFVVPVARTEAGFEYEAVFA